MHRRVLCLAAASLAALAVSATSQPEPAAPPPPPPQPEVGRAPVWSSPELEKIGSMLKGSWKTTRPVTQVGGDAGGSAEVAMSIAPVFVDGLTDAMYVEVARADSLWAPYWQAVYQLYAFKGKTRLRTYEFHRTDMGPAITGLWLVPSQFPTLDRADLIATLDIELSPQGGGYSGKTPYPYPTGTAGAVEMTSEVTITQDKIVAADRGYDASGKVVWGSQPNETYEFARYDTGLKAENPVAGLYIITYVQPNQGNVVQRGDRVSVHTTGWLTDGFKFYTTRDPGGQPMTFQQGVGMIDGFIEGAEAATEGTRRRFIVPPALGYGDAGNPRAKIPGGAVLIFDVEFLAIERPKLPEPQPGDAGQPGAAPEPNNGNPPQPQPQPQPVPPKP